MGSIRPPEPAAGEGIRVLLCHEEALLRAALAALLVRETGFLLAGEASCRGDGIPAVETGADVVLLSPPEDLEGAALAHCLARWGRTPVLLLAPRQDQEQIHAAVRAGVAGVVYRDEAPAQLFRALRQVCAGEMWLDRGLSASVLRELRHAGRGGAGGRGGLQGLSRRELQISGYVAQGLNASRIAARLFLSEKTVRNHLSAIYRKLELANQLELALYAARHGLGRRDEDPARGG